MWARTSQPTSPSSISIPHHPPESPTFTKTKYKGRRFAQIVKLKAECYDKYKECHVKVWPEVLQKIRQSNIEDYSIYYDKDTNILFASFKYVGYNFDNDMERMAENEKVKEWWRMTDSLQESLVEGAKSSETGTPPWWKRLEEVFYVE